jgi:hypothetical protein
VRTMGSRQGAMAMLHPPAERFRAQELASLTRAAFRLDGATPTATVAAAYSKHKREDVQPIRPELAAVLRAWIADRPAGERLWPGKWWIHAAKMVRADLAAARANWINGVGEDAHERERRERSDSLTYTDADGRVFDFHSLRGQFVSALEAAGVSLKMLQTLARHSDIKTTLKHYARVQVSDAQAALDKLPPLPSPVDPESVECRATGTGGRVAPCTRLAHISDIGREKLQTVASIASSGDVSQDEAAITVESGRKRLELRGPSRIRTGDGGFAIHCLTTWLRGLHP